MDKEEVLLKVGDVCLDCQQQGIEKHLRLFKINLNGDTLLKCESNECMYPYNDEMFSSDEDEDVTSFSETNSIKFIDDLLQEIKNEGAEKNSKYDVQINDNENINNNIQDFKVCSNEALTQFEISFFDTFEEIVNENLSIPHISTESTEYLDTTNVTQNNTSLSLPTIDTVVEEQSILDPIGKVKDNDSQSLLPSFPNTDTQQNCKQKINIQSIENIKIVTSDHNNSPSSPIISNVSTQMSIKAGPKTSSSELSAKISKPFSKPNVINIPKANIMTGSDFLKKLAIINEKTPKYSKKFKGDKKRINAKEKKIRVKSYNDDLNLSTNEKKDIINQAEIIKEKQDSCHTDMNYTLETISELLIANKKKKIELKDN